MQIYPYNQHEGGETDQMVAKLALLRELWG